MRVGSCRFVDGLDPAVEYDVFDDINIGSAKKLVQGSQTNLIERLVIETLELRLRDRHVLELLTVADVFDLLRVWYRFLRW